MQYQSNRVSILELLQNSRRRLTSLCEQLDSHEKMTSSLEVTGMNLLAQSVDSRSKVEAASKSIRLMK